MISNRGSRAPAGQDCRRETGRSPNALVAVEQRFSCEAAAARCDEVSRQLIVLAESLRSAWGNPGSLPTHLCERSIVESLIRGRRLREKFFEPRLFADPVWDILLELYLARLDQRRITISSLCVAASVPPTTALRHISSLVERGMVVRRSNPFDGRTIYVELAEPAISQMQAFVERFSQLLHAAFARSI